MATYPNTNSYTTQHQYGVTQYSGGPGEQSYHTHTTKSMGHHQAQLDEVGCPVVSSTSPQEHEGGLEMRGCSVRQHDNIGSIITMLIADQSVDLEDILTDGIRAEEIQGGHTHTHTHTHLQDTVIKEETDGLGLEYTGYSPDYSLYQRDYGAQSEEPVGECRSRSLSSLSSSSEGDDETQYRTGAQYSQPDTVGGQARIQPYSTPQYRQTTQGQDRGIHTTKPGEKKDEKYWERRRKNNLAAKKSRDARRVRENQLRLRVLCLENANRVLREQMDRKHLETVQLRERLSKYESVEEICPENTSPPKM